MPRSDITCTSCRFEETAGITDEDPSAIIRRHGHETGHILTFSVSETGNQLAAD